MCHDGCLDDMECYSPTCNQHLSREADFQLYSYAFRMYFNKELNTFSSAEDVFSFERLLLYNQANIRQHWRLDKENEKK